MGNMKDEINKWILNNQDWAIERGMPVPRRKSILKIKEVRKNERVFDNERSGGHSGSTPGNNK